MNILITGASQGIGLATAKKLADKGHHVGLFDINVTQLETLTRDKVFNHAHKQRRFIYGRMDVTQPDDWDDALAKMQTDFGGLDVLINNAGLLVAEDLPKTDLTKQLQLIDVNCKGVLIGCQQAAQPLTGRKNSKIINLSSASAIYGQAQIANYSASKFYVRGLTEALNIEYQALGIKVIDVMPLWVKTDMTADVEVTSMSRLGVNLRPEDVADNLCHLATTPNKYIKKTHYPVGLPAKVLTNLAPKLPASVIHWINQKIGV